MAAALLAISRTESVDADVTIDSSRADMTSPRMPSKRVDEQMFQSPTSDKASSLLQFTTPEQTPVPSYASAATAPNALKNLNYIGSPVAASNFDLFNGYNLGFGGGQLASNQDLQRVALQAVAAEVVSISQNAPLFRLMSSWSNEVQGMLSHPGQAVQTLGSRTAPRTLPTPYAAGCEGAPAHEDDGDYDDDGASPVRQQEIEKALLSKSQRGRKRANLNEVERLELTRTRNREHAKTTRLRKKARYQELLDGEQKLKALVRRDDLALERRQVVLAFVAVRERMLRSATGCQIEDNETAQQVLLGELAEDVSALTYRDNSGLDDGTPALDRMKRFDVSVASSAQRKFGSDHSSLSVSYQVKGSVDDIAISPIGSALAEIEIVGPGDERWLSALLKIDFAPTSAKIRAVALTAAVRHTERQQQQQPEPQGGGGGGDLDAQISHPSVVSLDIDKDRRESDEGDVLKRMEMHEESGPGMII